MEPLAVDFTVDGRHVVGGGGDKVTAYLHAANGKYLAVAFFKADDMFAAAPIVVRDESGRKAVEWMPPAFVPGRCWTEDGRLLAGLAAKDSLQIWRVFPTG